jgi:hypothetical protein
VAEVERKISIPAASGSGVFQLSRIEKEVAGEAANPLGAEGGEVKVRE